MRHILTLVHRWTGLVLAIFLIVVAATGAILPFQTELQRIIAPERFVAPPRAGARILDWLTLHRIAEARSGGIVSTLSLYRDGDTAMTFNVVPKPGQPDLGFDEIVLDPYSGREIDRATGGALSDGKAQIVPFLYLVHQSLALGDWGTWLLGIVAIAWTLDCFIGFYLTLPAGRRRGWSHWSRSWRIRLPVKPGFRLNFDLHRAAGLWVWPMLFVFAWTGVAFNLPQVHDPVMHMLTGFESEAPLPPVAIARPPLLDWAQAVGMARKRASEIGSQRGIIIGREREIRYVARTNSYSYAIRTSLDRTDDGANSWIYFDGDTGRLLGVNFPTGQNAGNTIDYWMGLLHEASVFGLPFRIFVSFMGVLIVVLTVTGILIWLRKRSARRWHSLERGDQDGR